MIDNTDTAKQVSFLSNGIKIAANIYYPNNTRGKKLLPSIVVSHPAGGVKEQTAGLYAKRLAEIGFITLTFDAAYQGESEGTPRGLEEPAQRVEDIRSAVAFLTNVKGVDAKNIGVLGICASGGYTLVAVATDHNVKALATVSGVDLGDWYRRGSDGNQAPDTIQHLLDKAAADKISVAAGNAPGSMPIHPQTEEDAKEAGGMAYEGWKYYCTKEGYHQNAATFFLWSSIERIAGFFSPHFANLIAPRPVLMIAGTAAQTLWMTKLAYDRSEGDKQLFLIEGATHVDLYFKEEYVSQAVRKLDEFFRKNLDCEK